MLFLPTTGGDSDSTSTKLERGRENGVQRNQYHGEVPEDISFDVAALWAYLVERAEQTSPCNMDGMISLFEDEFHDIPVVIDEQSRLTWQARNISDAPNGDDIKNIAAVSHFVESYALYYAHHDSKSPLAEQDDSRRLLGRLL